MRIMSSTSGLELGGNPLDEQTNDSLIIMDGLPIPEVCSDSNGSEREAYIELLRKTLQTARKNPEIGSSQALPLTVANLHAHNNAIDPLRRSQDRVMTAKPITYHRLNRRPEENELGEAQRNEGEETSCINTTAYLCCRMITRILVIALIAGILSLILQKVNKH